MLDPFFQVNTIAMWLFSIVGFNNNSLVAALYCQLLQITYWQQFQYVLSTISNFIVNNVNVNSVGPSEADHHLDNQPPSLFLNQPILLCL